MNFMSRPSFLLNYELSEKANAFEAGPKAQNVQLQALRGHLASLGAIRCYAQDISPPFITRPLTM
jgi:hypothetical protein